MSWLMIVVLRKAFKIEILQTLFPNNDDFASQFCYAISSFLKILVVISSRKQSFPSSTLRAAGRNYSTCLRLKPESIFVNFIYRNPPRDTVSGTGLISRRLITRDAHNVSRLGSDDYSSTNLAAKAV